ncbi:MAG: hypothetical protein LBQ42_12320 [Synergistaceae bacterium]|nr:hypothetical protein [Synergistaceae bacterium]
MNKKFKYGYSFVIREFDLEVERNPDWSGDWGLGQWKYFVRLEYDHHGNLAERYECIDGIGYERMPGDETDDAGVKFAVGDFVTVEGGRADNRTWVVYAPPGRQSECKRPEIWENIYTLLSVNGHDHFHERFLRPYKGHIPEDSPLMFLRGVVAGEIKLDEDTMNDVYFGGIGCKKH